MTRVAIRKPYTAPSAPTLGEYPAQALVAGDIGSGFDSLYWTRPYPNPDAAGGGDEYLWLGSTDHATSNNGRIYRGFSASPATLPATWTNFVPAGGDVSTQNETPSFVYNTGHARPYWLYWHPSTSESGNGQSSRLTTHTSAAWESGTDEGEVLPATADSPALDHTGYANVYRVGASDWKAWTFTRSFATHGRAEYGYWTSTDGLSWTIVNDDLDTRSMVTGGDMLVVRAFNRFQYGGTWYAILTQHPDDVSTGGNNADPGGEVVLCSMPDEQTFVFVQRLWGPLDDTLTDDLRDVRAYQDPGDDALIHLYIHNTRTAMLYGTLEMEWRMLNDDLVWYYSLDEASGQRNDSVGTNHLTDNNTVASAAGLVGNAADFEEAGNESLSIASNATMQMGDIDWTLACWVFHETVTGLQSYIAKAATSTASTWEYNFRANAGVVQLFVANGSTNTSVSGATLSTATWYFLVGIHDSINNELRLYINAGTPTTQAIAIAPQAGAGIFRLGARANTPSNHLDGLMDEAAGWKRALTSGEITELYNGGAGRNYAYVSGGGGGGGSLFRPAINVQGIHSAHFGGRIVR